MRTMAQPILYARTGDDGDGDDDVEDDDDDADDGDGGDDYGPAKILGRD